MPAGSPARGGWENHQPAGVWTTAGVSMALPRAERQDLIQELRGLTQGLGEFTAEFDHMAELPGRLAEQVAKGGEQHAG